MLLKLLPPMAIADLGAGEGTFSLLLAQRAEQVIAIDNSEKMVEYATGVARRNGVKNLEYRLGDLEELPIDRRRSRPGAVSARVSTTPCTRRRPCRKPPAS